MKGNPELIIVTHLKPFIFASFRLPEAVAFASNELQTSELRNRGFEYKNE
jgi:hypothetical protein